MLRGERDDNLVAHALQQHLTLVADHPLAFRGLQGAHQRLEQVRAAVCQ